MMVNEESEDFEKAVLKMSIWSPRSYDQGYAMFLKSDLSIMPKTVSCSN